jgi:hypothetical protein
MEACKTKVKLGPGGRVIRHYKRNVEGARTCGSTEYHIEALFERVYCYGGWSDKDEFVGFEIRCARCGTIRRTYYLDDLERLVEKEWNANA